MTMLLPGPPSRTSTLAPPSSTSSHVSPRRVSAPSLPIRMSLPSPPLAVNPMAVPSPDAVTAKISAQAWFGVR
jgi:hypothetical protein